LAIWILDVDGVVNAHDLDLSNPDTRTGVVEWRKKTSGKEMVREQEVTWSQATIDFINNTGFEIFWLSAWKENTQRVLDKLVGIKSSGWIDWDQSIPEEGGKFLALQEFLNGSNVDFIWVDDVATKPITDMNVFLPNRALLLTPLEASGFDESHMIQVEKFIQTLA